ncbi:helix-turn-helix transcriptional regulator [Microvirgula aerodenitrificans]|uniref:helix-turn-helix transcriptional regulator n=1 Tax=Microvirgula aerodenitrificans TaxID=57480 RepID=UPI00048EE95E|nr:AraC family transcriptional regulator [Microvirgula aerodenitrificans]
MTPVLSIRRYDAEVRVHDHDHTQLVFGLRGGLRLELDGHGGCVGERQAAVIPPACRHAYAGDGLCLVADLPADAIWLGAALGPEADAGQRLLDQPRVLSLPAGLDGLVRWLSTQPLHDSTLGSHAAALLLSGLSRPAEAPGALPLAAIDAHIDRCAARPLQVADLARLAGLSVSRLHQRFLTETGLTPMDYVRRHRLALAIDLLQQTTLAVGEVAARVGYASQSAFTAALVRAHGLTPRDIRRRESAGKRQ